MPQSRGGKAPRQEHSVYVQQLFKDFLTRNNRKSTSIDHSNFLQPESFVQRKKPSLFDRAVYARFERDAKVAGLMRQESCAGFKTRLMNWIDQQRQQQKELSKKVLSTDYLNLADNFFSGLDRFKPVELPDGTLGNVTNNFVPPATSTPFQPMASFGVSGVLSDPDEFHPDEGIAMKDGDMLKEWLTFLKKTTAYLIRITHQNGLLESQRKELKCFLHIRNDINMNTHPYRCRDLRSSGTLGNVSMLPLKQRPIFDVLSPHDSSFISGQHNRNYQKRNTDVPTTHPEMLHYPLSCTYDDQQFETFQAETPLKTLLQRGTAEDILLSLSPPSPRKKSLQCLIGERKILLDEIRTDDTFMENLGALLDDDHSYRDERDFNFDVALQASMDFSLPNLSQVQNRLVEESFPVGKADIIDSMQHFSDGIINLF